MKKNLLISAFSLCLLFSLGLSSVYAQGTRTNSGDAGRSNPTIIKLENPFKVGNNLYDLAKAIVNNIILPVGAVLCVLAFIYSGFLYVTAQGDTNKIKTAHTALLYSAIGTAVLLGSWVLATVIQNTIQQVIS